MSTFVFTPPPAAPATTTTTQDPAIDRADVHARVQAAISSLTEPGQEAVVVVASAPATAPRQVNSSARKGGRKPSTSPPLGLPGLAAILAARNWTTLRLAAEINASPATVANAANGVSDPTLGYVRAMARVLGVSADDLMTADETCAASDQLRLPGFADAA